MNDFSFSGLNFVKMIERPAVGAGFAPFNPYFIGPKQEERPNPVGRPGPGGLPW